MKILTIIEFSPGTKLHRRSAFQAAMTERGFVRLPGVSATWVADRKFTSVELARDSVSQAAALADLPIHKAYVVEYGDYAVFPQESRRRGAPASPQ
jgi:hypothetical protein